MTKTKLGKCECCNFEDIEVTEYIENNSNNSFMFLCEICAKTSLSQIISFSKSNEMLALAQSIGWIGNHLKQLIIQNKTFKSEYNPNAGGGWVDPRP